MNKLISAVVTAGVILAVAAPALAATKTVKVADDLFKASVVKIHKGDTVTWKWTGNNPHNVTFRSFASKTQVNGRYKHRFARRGSFRYVCTIHSGMIGKVVVR